MFQQENDIMFWHHQSRPRSMADFVCDEAIHELETINEFGMFEFKTPYKKRGCTKTGQCKKCHWQWHNYNDTCLGCAVKAKPNDFYPCPMCRRPMPNKSFKDICLTCDVSIISSVKYKYVLRRQWIVDLGVTVKPGDPVLEPSDTREGFYFGNNVWKKLDYLPCFTADGTCIEKPWEPTVAEIHTLIEEQWESDDNRYSSNPVGILTTDELRASIPYAQPVYDCVPQQAIRIDTIPNPSMGSLEDQVYMEHTLRCGYHSQR